MSELAGIDTEENEDFEMKSGDKPIELPKRKPFHVWTVDGMDHKLKLKTAMVRTLEEKYRTNLLNLVMADNIPPLSVMLTIIQAAMTPWEHKIKLKNVEDIYDQYLEEGGDLMSLYTKVIMPTLACSGFFTQSQTEDLQERLEKSEELQ